MAMTTGDWYATFASHEAAGHSDIYERLALAVSTSPDLLDRLEGLPEEKRQPNLLFAAVRAVDGPVKDPQAFEQWVIEHWDRVASTMLARRTQTNEPRRCATLLPFLAAIDGPLALIEVGASAGLCLYPDRWQYRYGDTVLGEPTAPTLTCQVTGPFRAPANLPDVVWRAGLDLNPLNVSDSDDVAWLEALIWPEQIERRERLHQAIDLARREPAHLVAGDLNDGLVALAAKAPANATLVVFHSAVLTYLTPEKRAHFVEQVTDLPGVWISNEGPGVLPDVASRIPAGKGDSQRRFLTAVNGIPVAWSGGHGQTIELF